MGNALKRTGLSTGDMTSQEEVKQQRTRRNVLTSLPQSSEAVSGVSGSLPRSALSRVQTLGEERMRVQCLATGSVVLNALKRTGLSTGDMTSQEEVKQQRTRRNVLTSLPQSSE